MQFDFCLASAARFVFVFQIRLNDTWRLVCGESCNKSAAVETEGSEETAQARIPVTTNRVEVDSVLLCVPFYR